MWRESAFTKNMDECGRLAEGRTRDTSPLSPTSAAASTEGPKRQQPRSDPTVCERLRGKGDKNIHEWLKTISLCVPKHETSPYRTPKERVTAHDDCFEMVLLVRRPCGVTMATVWCVEAGEKKIKFWCLRSLLIELKVLPSDSSWCRVKTATKPRLSCNI